MKAFLILTATFLYTAAGFAQVHIVPAGHMRTFNSQATAKGTSTRSRLVIAAHSRGAANRPQDSVAYTYSNGRGGDLNHPLQYDTKTTYTYWDTVQQAFQQVQQSLVTYNAAGLPDTQLHQQSVSGSFATGGRTTYYYDALGRDTAEKLESYSNTWTPVQYLRQTYDNGNRLTSQTFLYWQNGQFVNGNRITWTYNAAGRLTSQVAELWLNNTWTMAGESDYYTYDATGRLTRYEWHNYSSANGGQTTYHYSGTDTTYQSAAEAGYFNNGPFMRGDSAVVTAKNAAGNILMLLHYSYTDTLYYRENFTYTAAALTASHLYEFTLDAGLSWQPGIRVLYDYNSYDQLTRIYSRYWNGSAWASGWDDSDCRYYYEEYQSSLSTPAYTAAGNSLKIWPVPAQGPLMLQFSPLKPGTYTAELLDLSGRRMMSSTGTAQKVETLTLDVSHYPSGSYRVRISCGGEVMTRSIVVQH